MDSLDIAYKAVQERNAMEAERDEWIRRHNRRVEEYKELRAMCDEAIESWSKLRHMSSWSCGGVYNEDHVDEIFEDLKEKLSTDEDKEGEDE